MIRLASTLYSMVATALAGTAVISVLVAGSSSVTLILLAGATGFVIAVPISWLLAKNLYQDG